MTDLLLNGDPDYCWCNGLLGGDNATHSVYGCTGVAREDVYILNGKMMSAKRVSWWRRLWLRIRWWLWGMR